MHFPYMRIAIYVLTFLTYAYSGYGSKSIGHLRDAIISAEAIFGDVFKNLITVVRNFHTVHDIFDAAVEETCAYKCPQAPEIRPVQNKQYTPSADGCGTQGLRIDKEFLPTAEMEVCCNAHDICYDTCNSDKELCDLDFKRCLYKYCESYENSSDFGIITMGCKPAAKMLFAGTLTLGCKAFLSSQQRTCYCAPPKPGKDEKNYNSGKNGGYGERYYKGKKQKH